MNYLKKKTEEEKTRGGLIKEIGRTVLMTTKNPELHRDMWHYRKNKFNVFSKYDGIFYSERIVEIPFVLRNVPKKSCKILEFGNNKNKLSIELASMGHKVIGVDLLPYDLRHPNLKFIQGNFMDAKIEKNSMDVIVAVSAIEHCGCGSYGDKKGLTTDKEVVQRMKQILKPNGKLIITILSE